MGLLRPCEQVYYAARSSNEKMEELEFERTLAVDLYEQETKIYHKTMRFEKIEILD